MRMQSVIVMSLLVGLACGSVTFAQAVVESGQSVIVTPAEKLKPHTKVEWEVRAWGQNDKDAIQDAAKKAESIISDYLRRVRERDFVFKPNALYIEKHLIASEPRLLDQIEPQKFKYGNEHVTVKAYAVKIAITDQDYQKLIRKDEELRVVRQRQERIARIAQRELILGEVLILALICVGAITGYLRLQQRSRMSIGIILTSTAVLVFLLIALATVFH